MLTRLRAAEQARGGSQLPAAIYPPRACKDRCMRKSVGGWSACVNFAFFCRWVRKISKTESEGVKNEKKCSKRMQKGAKQSQKGSKVNQNEKMDPKGTQKGAKREPKGAKSEPKGAKREPRGAKRKPKGAKREAKRSQRATRMHLKIDLRKSSRKRGQKGQRFQQK